MCFDITNHKLLWHNIFIIGIIKAKDLISICIELSEYVSMFRI